MKVGWSAKWKVESSSRVGAGAVGVQDDHPARSVSTSLVGIIFAASGPLVAFWVFGSRLGFGLLEAFRLLDLRGGFSSSVSSSRYSCFMGMEAMRAEEREGGTVKSSLRFLVGRLVTGFEGSITCFLWIPRSFNRARLRLIFSSL